VLTQTVTQGGTSTALSSSQNPSTFGQSVTFTATVTSGGGTPTGTVTFKDGGAVIGTGPLNGLGVATFTISTLAVGSHSITATYSGDANFTASTSPAVLQAVDVPADSLKLRALQIAVTKIVAQSSGQAISGAIDGAISDGFNEGGDLITPGANGLHFNFSAEPQEQPESKVEERVGDAFAAFGYAPRDKVVKAASPSPSPREPKDWVAWADVRGIGWNTSLQTGDIRGGQTNAVIGLTRKVTPNFLVGMLAGYEGFDYSSRLLNGNLKGKGWTLGGYLGWRLLPSLRFDAGLARSNIAYDGVAGTAAGSFTGERWLISGGLTGSYKMMSGLEIEPSARVYALWERENAYQDTLGFQQTERKFSTGRASAGAKLIYPWMWSATMTLAPYAGLYADYYFSKDDATTTLLLPSESVHGWSARINSGVALSIANGAKLSIGGEVGGLGSSQFINWSLRGYASIPF
jgi:outer membrane autotransporter protein